MKKIALFFCFLLGYMSYAFSTPNGDSAVYTLHINAISTQPHMERISISTKNAYSFIELSVDSPVLPKDILLSFPTFRHNKNIVKTLVIKGEAEYNKGNFEKSIAYLQQILKYCGTTDINLTFQIFNRIANCYVVQGQYSEAADNYYKALEVSQLDAVNIKKANIYNNLSVVWLQLGETKKSLFYLVKAETTAIIEKDTLALSNILNRKGNTYLQLSDTLNAYKCYTNAIRLSRICGNKSNETMAISNIGYLYILEGKYAMAEPYINTLLESSYNQELNIFHRLSMKYSYGWYCFLSKNYGDAKRIWIATEKEAMTLNAHLYRLKPLLGLSILYAKNKDFDNAIKFRHLHNSLKDRIITAKKLAEVSVLEQKYQLAQKEKKIALQKLKVEQQKSAAFKQNISIVAFGLALFLLILIYIMIKRNNRRQLLLAKEQTSTLQKEIELNRIRAIMEGEEKERKRVALELHDGVGSMLSMAKLNLSVVYDQYKDDQRSNGFMNVLQLLDQSSTILRNTAHSLVPDILLHSGIDNGLHELCRKTAQIEGTPVFYQSYGIPTVNKIQEKNLFRLFQDMIKMIIHYSKPLPVLFQLNWQEHLLYVTIEAYPGHASLSWTETEATPAWTLLKKKIEATKGVITVDSRKGEATVWDLEFEIE